jgi:hypothetical protein
VEPSFDRGRRKPPADLKLTCDGETVLSGADPARVVLVADVMKVDPRVRISEAAAAEDSPPGVLPSVSDWEPCEAFSTATTVRMTKPKRRQPTLPPKRRKLYSPEQMLRAIFICR